MSNLLNKMQNWIRASKPGKDEPSMIVSAAVPVEIQAAKGEGGRPTYAMTAYSGGPMLISTSYYPVYADLQGMRLTRKDIPNLRDHDQGRVIGQIDSHKIDASGLHVTGIVTDDGPEGQSVVNNAKNGFKWQASIGAQIVRREFVEAGKTASVNGQQVTGPVVIARETLVHEVSFVSVGGDQNTAVSVAASFDVESTEMKTLNEWIQARGFDPAKLEAKQIESLKLLHEAEIEAGKSIGGTTAQNSAIVQPQNGIDVKAALAEIQKESRAESARVAKINAACAKNPDIAAKAIEEGWTSDAAELAVFRAKMGSGPAHIVVNNEVNDTIIECAIARAGSLEGYEKQYDEKTLEAAHRRFRQGIGLQELLMIQASQSEGGHLYTNFRSNHRDIIRAAFSTHTLSGILAATANKFLLAGYNSVENTWDKISAKRNVSDFKAYTSYRMTGAMEFEEVGPAGEIKHGTVGEDTFTNQAKTYAKMLAITRQDQINDDLGALTDVPRRLGRGGALKLNRVFWLAFLDNTSFFSTAHSNLVETATYVLGAVGLKKAVTTFRKLTDSDGNPMATAPKYLLVPPELETTADELFKSTNFNTGGSASTAQVPSSNVFANKYMPLVSTYLSNTAMTGYSLTGYYLLADPADVPTVEVAFLNGVTSPMVETAESDFNTLGIEMRGVFDFGVAKQDYRGGVRVNGA